MAQQFQDLKIDLLYSARDSNNLQQEFRSFVLLLRSCKALQNLTLECNCTEHFARHTSHFLKTNDVVESKHYFPILPLRMYQAHFLEQLCKEEEKREIFLPILSSIMCFSVSFHFFVFVFSMRSTYVLKALFNNSSGA